MKSLCFKVTVLVFMREIKQSSNPDAAQMLIQLFCMTSFINMVIIYVKTHDKSWVCLPHLHFSHPKIVDSYILKIK